MNSKNLFICIVLLLSSGLSVRSAEPSAPKEAIDPLPPLLVGHYTWMVTGSTEFLELRTSGDYVYTVRGGIPFEVVYREAGTWRASQFGIVLTPLGAFERTKEMDRRRKLYVTMHADGTPVLLSAIRNSRMPDIASYWSVYTKEPKKPDL